MLEEITIHHTGDRIGKSEYPTINEIQAEQIASGEYSDIAYHYAIDEAGQIFEGRPLGVRGAHAEDANTGNVGVLFLRDFQPGPWYDVDSSDDAPPSANQLNAANILVQTLDINYGISSVQGHNDVFTGTECPGDILEPYIPGLNALVQNPTPGLFA